MKKFFISGLLLFSFVLLCAVTPMTDKIPAGQVTTIECEFNKKTAKCPKWAWDAYKTEHPNLAKETVFHYKVYLPDDYYDNPKKCYPCMFITSPGGNANLGKLGPRLKSDKWIAIMLVESKNNSPEWLSNFIAAHDDAVKRFRIQEGMKYATGMSGGARCAGTQVGVRPGFAGVILQGAGFNYNNSGSYIYGALKANKGIAVCVTMGNDDSNKKEIPRLRSELPKQNPVKYIMFPGGHVWAPADVMDQAMDWMAEQLVYTTKNKDVCRLVFSEQLTKLKHLDDGFGKYEKLLMLANIVSKHKLQKYPEVSKHLKDIKTQLATLKKDKNTSKELKAKKAYELVKAKEDKVMGKIAAGKIKTKKVHREKEKLIRYYKAMVKANPGMLYTKKAENKISELEHSLKK